MSVQRKPGRKNKPDGRGEGERGAGEREPDRLSGGWRTGGPAEGVGEEEEEECPQVLLLHVLHHLEEF